jgi:hypothetical protein
MACEDAQFLLADSDFSMDDTTFVIIGGWANGQSAMRLCAHWTTVNSCDDYSPLDVFADHSPLDCDGYRKVNVLSINVAVFPPTVDLRVISQIQRLFMVLSPY